MPRVKFGAARHLKKVRTLKAARGFRGARRNHYRLAKEALVRAGVSAYRDRRLRKREFRSLWIIRLSGACDARGLQYSRFVDGCRKAGIELNRKMLSEIAIHDPAAFDAIVALAKSKMTVKAA